MCWLRVAMRHSDVIESSDSYSIHQSQVITQGIDGAAAGAVRPRLCWNADREHFRGGNIS